MEVHNFQEIQRAISSTREEFYKTVVSIEGILDSPCNLYFDVIALIKNVAKDTDDERYVLEALATTFRRVIGSFALLESGLPQEAHILLRNALEFMLISIDIAYNKNSLAEWKKTVHDDLKKENYDDWYFKKLRICKRIEENPENIYPELERKLVVGVGGVPGNSICVEWGIISNMSVHAHSQAQIRNLFDEQGNFQLLGRKSVVNYAKDFQQYRVFIMNIISILIGIPKYRQLIIESTSLTAQANNVAGNYSKLLKEIGTTPELMERKDESV